MRNKIIGKCPICGKDLEVTKLYCNHCRSGVEGRFEMCKFCRLSPEQQHFVEIFLRSRGNIKEVERELGISYPTVRGRLDEVIRSLGFQVDVDERSKERAKKRKEVLEALSKGEMTSEEALGALKFD